MTLLLDRPIAAGSTLYPHDSGFAQNRNSEDDFYLLGARPGRRITIRVNGRRTWLAGYIEDQVNSLLELPCGWDGRMARPITDEAIWSVTRLILEITGDLPLPPQIFPLSDGGIQFEWHAGGEDIEVEVEADGSAHALATDESGFAWLDMELRSGSPLAPVREAVQKLVTEIASAR